MADKIETNGLSTYGYMHLDSEISNVTVRPIIETIIVENLKPDNERMPNLTLIINSNGGDLPTAFALIDVMKGSSIPIRTLGLGTVASAGLMVFMSGEKGHRILTPNTQVLSHQFSWGSYGKEHELLARVDEFQHLSERVIKLYVENTGLSKKVIKDKLLPAKDVWMTAKEAVVLGLADEVRAMY